MLDAFGEIVDQLTLGIGQRSVLEVADADARSNHTAWHADDRGMIGNRMNDDGSRADLGMVANQNVAQDFRAGSDDHIVADGGMPLAFLFAGSAQRHALIEQHVVADFGSLANDDAHSVIDKAAPSDGGAGMDFNAGQGAIKLRDDAGEQRKAGRVKLMGGAMQEDGMEAGVTEKDLDRALGRGVSAKNGLDLFPDGSKHTGFL